MTALLEILVHVPISLSLSHQHYKYCVDAATLVLIDAATLILESSIKKSNQAEIELKELEPYAMEAILTCAYTGEIVVNTDNVQDLLPGLSRL